MALAVGAVGLFLTAWALGCWIDRTWPARDIGPHTSHLRALARDPAAGDVLVLGASRLLNGFAPRVFEAELAARGITVRATNLSLQRLQLWEIEPALAAALAVPGVRPRLVVIEPATGLGVAPENLTHARTLHFETPAAFALSVAAIRESGRPVWHQAWNIGMHGAAAILRASGYGRLGALAFPPVGASVEDGAGYLALPGLAEDAAAAPELVWAKERLAAELPAWREAAPPLPGALARHFDGLRDRLEALGLRVVFVLPPVLAFPDAFYRGQILAMERRALSGEAGSAMWLSFLDPAKHGELFEPRWWHDYQHLRSPGAECFTRRLAGELAPYLAEGDAP